MVRARGWIAAALVVQGLVGCQLLKKKVVAADGGEDAPSGSASAAPEVAPPAASASALAANEPQVTRYPDEKSGDRVPVTTETEAHLRTQAGGAGDLIVVLKKGTEVEKVAEHGDSYLVITDDPKDPSRKLLGWVGEATFGPESALRHASPPGDGGAHEGHGDGGAHEGHKPDGGAAKPVLHACTKQDPPGQCPKGFIGSAGMCRLPCSNPGDCRTLDAKCTLGLCYSAASGCP